MICRSRMLLTTCLQGVYQSNQGTAAAVQVNNVNLVLGRIGRPGCVILQMNGQPTAQNSRETGTGGDMPGFRNFADFLNARRIEAARTALADPDKARLPVSSIAFDLGYASLGPFNRAFKDATGLTPTAWRARVQGGSPELSISRRFRNPPAASG